MIYPNIRVPVPDTGGYSQQRGSVRYYYVYVGDRKKDAKGHSTHPRSVMIGRLEKSDADPNQVLLMPNEAYYTLMNLPKPDVAVAEGAGRKPYKEKAKPLEERKRHTQTGIGYDVVVRMLSIESGLRYALDEAFGKSRAEKIMLLASYLNDGPHSSLSGLNDFIRDYMFITDALAFDRRAAGELIADLSTEDCGTFWSVWGGQQKLKGMHIFYDVTSFSTYSGNITAARYGYNRDGEDLPQINTGLLCLRENGLPLYMCSYDGSLNDAQNFNYVLRRASAAGLDLKGKKPTLVMDGGFSKDNCNFAHLKGFPLIIGVSVNRYKAVKQAYLSWAVTLTSKDRQKAFLTSSDKHYIATSVPFTLGDVQGNLYLYKDLDVQEQRNKQLLREIDAKRAYLTELSGVPDGVEDFDSWAKGFAPYFKVTRARGRKGFTFCEDEEGTAEAFNLCGKVAIFASGKPSDPKTVLELYRSKESVEDCFDTQKNGLSDKRLHIQGDKQAEGKLFVMTVALIIRRLMTYRLRSFKQEHNLTMSEIITQLKRLKAVKLTDDKWKIKDAPSKLQKEIINALKLEGLQKQEENLTMKPRIRQSRNKKRTRH